MDRPPSDPTKLLASWVEWERGESTAGRVMADLKMGGLREVMEHLATSGDDAATIADTWMRWEKGEAAPVDVMVDLQAKGLRSTLESLASEQAPAGS